MHSKYILIGFTISYYFSCTSMGLEEDFLDTSLNCFDNSQHIKDKKRKRKNLDNLEWKIEAFYESSQETTDNGEPKLKLILARKIPLHFYNSNHNKEKVAKLTKTQEKFLEKIKNIELPYILSPKEKEIFDSLQYRFVFTLEETTKGWQIDENRKYRDRKKIIWWP